MNEPSGKPPVAEQNKGVDLKVVIGLVALGAGALVWSRFNAKEAAPREVVRMVETPVIDTGAIDELRNRLAAETQERQSAEEEMLAAQKKAYAMAEEAERRNAELLAAQRAQQTQRPAPPRPVKTGTMVRLAGGAFRTPNAKCKHCSAMLVIGEIKQTQIGIPDYVICPRCNESIDSGHAKVRYEIESQGGTLIENFSDGIIR